jgi:hypothetical protein
LSPITENAERVDLTKQALNNLDGTYQCTSKGAYYNLEAALLLHDGANYKTDRCIPEKIRLKIIDNMHLEVKYYLDTTMVRRRIIRGQLKEGYFQANYLGYFKPLYGIINYYSDRKARIGLLKSGNLIVDASSSGTLLLIIIPASSRDFKDNGMEFGRIN